MEIKHAYETIVIGGGAAGLFFGAAAPSGRDILILEKTKQTGTKLLMSGSGQCNLTHCGSIKEFLLCYGKNGNKIRTCLYRHSNLALCRFMEGLGISLIEREDGKIFPRSMDAREVRGALLHACAQNGVTIRTQAEVTAIRALPQGSVGNCGSKQTNCFRSQASDAVASDARDDAADTSFTPAAASGTQSKDDAADINMQPACTDKDVPKGICKAIAVQQIAAASPNADVRSAAPPRCANATASDTNDAASGAQADGDPAPCEKAQLDCAPDLGAGFALTLADGTCLACRNLVIAAGGASYPTTGSDGTLLDILALAPPAGLGIPIVPPRPALTPVFIENYPFADLAGISLRDIELKIFSKPQENRCGEQTRSMTEEAAPMFSKKNKKQTKPQSAVGDLLLTHKNLSGPVILNHAREISAGTRLAINFVFPYTVDTVISRLKADFSGCRSMISAYIGEQYHLPKRFVAKILHLISLTDKPLAAISGSQMCALSEALAAWPCTVSGTGGFREAMATAGGVSLDAVNLSSMECRDYPGLFFAGEMLDIDGDTGGYNLQFAYASAMAALTKIYRS